MKPRILVAGIGNIFRGDDAFGCEVARSLVSRPKVEGIKIEDFGIRGFDLAYELADGGYELAILVDAVQRGREPGTLYLIEPDLDALGAMPGESIGADPHGMHPARVLAWAKTLGPTLPMVRLVGCEPEQVGGEEGDVEVGLSPRVQAAIAPAVEMVERVIRCTS